MLPQKKEQFKKNHWKSNIAVKFASMLSVCKLLTATVLQKDGEHLLSAGQGNPKKGQLSSKQYSNRSVSSVK